MSMKHTREALGLTEADKGFRVKVVDFDGRIDDDVIDGLPDECPRCHAKGTPTLWGSHGSVSPDHTMRLALKCPNRRCGRLYFAVYRRGRIQGAFDSTTAFILSVIEPFEFRERDFGSHIGTVSPRFCRIMNQATHAEARGLDEIAGPGYRKALEVLIKDFAKLPYEAEAQIAKDAGDASAQAGAEKHIDQIEHLFLGPCIKQYIDDPRIKDIAERAIWLGNDETHYLRKWPEQDISALKRLIDLVIHFVRSHLEYVAALDEMPEGRK